MSHGWWNFPHFILISNVLWNWSWWCLNFTIAGLLITSFLSPPKLTTGWMAETKLECTGGVALLWHWKSFTISYHLPSTTDFTSHPYTISSTFSAPANHRDHPPAVNLISLADHHLKLHYYNQKQHFLLTPSSFIPQKLPITLPPITIVELTTCINKISNHLQTMSKISNKEKWRRRRVCRLFAANKTQGILQPRSSTSVWWSFLALQPQTIYLTFLIHDFDQCFSFGVKF